MRGQINLSQLDVSHCHLMHECNAVWGGGRVIELVCPGGQCGRYSYKVKGTFIGWGGGGQTGLGGRLVVELPPTSLPTPPLCPQIWTTSSAISVASSWPVRCTMPSTAWRP